MDARGAYKTKTTKYRKFLTKSRTFPDPSEEREASLGEFVETKVFGTRTTANQLLTSEPCPELQPSKMHNLFIMGDDQDQVFL